MQNPFDVQYQALLRQIFSEGIAEKNNRTGHVCQSLMGATMRFDLEKGFPLLSLRKMPLKVFIAEQVWFLTGNKDLTWLQKYTRIWDDFAENGNEVAAAYGYRWRHHFGRDQILGLVELLQNDPSSRHGVIHMWDPGDDGLWGGTKKKNVPCPYTFTAQILGGRLHLHLIIRSNDMMLGNPHDVAGFAVLSHFLAQKLKVQPGVLTVSISNAHVYDIHFENAQTIIDREVTHPPLEFQCPPEAFDRAEKGDDTLVEEVLEALSANYHPQESLGKMKIVL